MNDLMGTIQLGDSRVSADRSISLADLFRLREIADRLGGMAHVLFGR